MVVWDRDVWLTRAVAELRATFDAAGVKLPSRVTARAEVTAATTTGPALGECWASATTFEQVPAIIVHPALTDAATVLAVLVHELLHAADDGRSGHGPQFHERAARVGLRTDALPMTEASPPLQVRLEAVAARLGPYPSPTSGYRLTGWSASQPSL